MYRSLISEKAAKYFYLVALLLLLPNSNLLRESQVLFPQPKTDGFLGSLAITEAAFGPRSFPKSGFQADLLLTKKIVLFNYFSRNKFEKKLEKQRYLF